jgi:hypothetical protein
VSQAASLVAQLAAAGTPPELLAAVAEQLFSGQSAQAAIDARRANDRDRKTRKSREVTGTDVTEREVTVENATPSSDKVSPQTPLQTTSIPSPPFKPPASQKRGTRLAEDFQPPEDWIIWAMKKRGWSREEALDECECFTRHWQAKPGREALKLDWPKTWQNWAVNSRRRAGQREHGGLSVPC